MTLVGLFLALLRLLLALGFAFLRLLGCLLQQFPRLLILLGPAWVGPPTLYVVAVTRFLNAMMEGTFAQHIPPTLMRASVITLLGSAEVSMTTGTGRIITVTWNGDAVIVSARGTIMARSKRTRKGLIECHQVGIGLTTALGGTGTASGGGGGPTEGGIRRTKLSIGAVFVRIRAVTVGVSMIITTIMSFSLSIGNDGRNSGIIVGTSSSSGVTVWPRKSSPSERLVAVIGGHRCKRIFQYMCKYG